MKQLIDQSAHFFVGALASYGMSFLLGWWAIPFVIILALLRELIQHLDFDLGSGSAIDMLFWILGAGTGGLLYYLI